MMQAFIKVMVSEVLKILTMPLHFLPVRKNRILFTGLTGGAGYDYSCNPKYLYEYMRDHYPKQFEYIWAVSDKKKYAFLEEEDVKLIKHFTPASIPYLLTSGVIVTNGSYAPWFPFRKKQYVINTWHGGGAYKKVENEKPDANWATRKRARFCADNIDLFVASCQKQEEQMIRTTFLYEGEVLRCGTPRNDKLVKNDFVKMRSRVREKYQIPQDGKIVLYAPTYRKSNLPVELDSDRLLACLGENWYVFSRYHRYMDDTMGIHIKGKHVIDVMDYPDMQELLVAADMLITDYSSCIWDYSFLNRPCFLYVPDKEEYTRKTGFYVSIDEWPYAQAENMEELLDHIRQYDEVVTQLRVEQHLQKLGSYETGECCRKIVEKICMREREK